MTTFKQQVMSNKPTFREIKSSLGLKNGNKTPKLTIEDLAVFCKSKKCPWLRNVNFGNGVHIPHCVLRGNEVKPHDRCKHLEDFIVFAKISRAEVEIDNAPIEDDNE